MYIPPPSRLFIAFVFRQVALSIHHSCSCSLRCGPRASVFHFTLGSRRFLRVQRPVIALNQGITTKTEIPSPPPLICFPVAAWQITQSARERERSPIGFVKSTLFVSFPVIYRRAFGVTYFILPFRLRLHDEMNAERTRKKKGITSFYCDNGTRAQNQIRYARV